MYLLTAQANRIGLFLFSPGKAAEELRLAPKAVNAGLLALCKRLGWQWDAAVRLLFIPTWWRYNAPESWNNLLGNLKDLAALPRSPLLDRFAAHTMHLPETMKSQFAQALAKGSPNPSPHPSPTQEHEQEQYLDLELEQKHDTDKSDSTSSSPFSSYSVEEARSAWNTIPGVKPCKSLTGVLLARISGLVKQHDEAWWTALFAEIRTSKFLTGKISKDGKMPFQATLDWVTEPDHLAKILAGNYANVTDRKSAL